MGDYTLMNAFCVSDVDEGAYRRDNTQYHVNLDDDPICLGGDYQSNKFYEWGLQFIEAHEQFNKEKLKFMTQWEMDKKTENDFEASDERVQLMEIQGFNFDWASYRPNHQHLIGPELMSPHRQPWFLWHSTIYAHGGLAKTPCAGLQFSDFQMAKYIR